MATRDGDGNGLGGGSDRVMFDQNQFPGYVPIAKAFGKTKSDAANRLRRYGYGIPSLDRARYSADITVGIPPVAITFRVLALGYGGA